MEYLIIVGVNFAIILATCILNTVRTKKPKRKTMVATSILLAFNLVFDIGCMAYFICLGQYEICKSVLLFLPMTIWLLYEAKKEAKNS